MKLTNINVSKQTIFILIFTSLTFFSFGSHFDNVQWEIAAKDKNVTLYSVGGDGCNYYKTEAIIDKSYGYKAEDLMNIILDYEKYQQIFVKTTAFSPVKETNKGTVVYCRIDFSPMKDRDYHILMTKDCTSDTQTLEWKPYNGLDVKATEKDCQRVNHVYGRWQFKDLPDGNVKLSTEYYNNWEYKNLSMKIVTPFERDVAVNNMKAFLRYVLKRK